MCDAMECFAAVNSKILVSSRRPNGWLWREKRAHYAIFLTNKSWTITARIELTDHGTPDLTVTAMKSRLKHQGQKWRQYSLQCLFAEFLRPDPQQRAHPAGQASLPLLSTENQLWSEHHMKALDFSLQNSRNPIATMPILEGWTHHHDTIDYAKGPKKKARRWAALIFPKERTFKSFCQNHLNWAQEANTKRGILPNQQTRKLGAGCPNSFPEAMKSGSPDFYLVAE